MDNNSVQNIALGLLFVLFCAVVGYGLKVGYQHAQSALLLGNIQALEQGVAYFKSDYNRYPTMVEFEDRNAMLDYFNQYPPIAFITPACPDSIVYKNPDAKHYQLYVCLPRAHAGFQTGWNQVIIQ